MGQSATAGAQFDAAIGPSGHSFVVSDIHLSDAQPSDPEQPLWKRFKGRDLFVDRCFGRFLEHAESLSNGPAELVLNGDIFDYDSVMDLPERPSFSVRWLESKRGLDPAEAKSTFKMKIILDDHPDFVAALCGWLDRGHRLVFVIGNHDIEMHWPSVQSLLRLCLDPEDQAGERLRFCEWFFVSGGDTLIEHGNQYDSYCVCPNPIHPTIRYRGEDIVRLPFGNLAGKYMLNGMGLFNPHVESSFIKPVWEYITFFVKYQLRIQPLLAWTWFWSALVTLWVSIGQGLLPALRDPFTVEQRMQEIATKSEATPGLVRGLLSVRVHPAVLNPWKIARELWLDRAVLLGLILFGTFQLFSFLNVFVHLQPWWWGIFFVIALPPFIFYARGVNSEVNAYERVIRRQVPKAARLAAVTRVVLGHTHVERHRELDGIQVLNPGTWSPAFKDVECTQPMGRKCFVWIRPQQEGNTALARDGASTAPRVAELREWDDRPEHPISVVIPVSE